MTHQGIFPGLGRRTVGEASVQGDIRRMRETDQQGKQSREDNNVRNTDNFKKYFVFTVLS